MINRLEIPKDITPENPAYEEYNSYNDVIDMCMNAGAYSRDLLMRIVRDNENTEYGKKYGFSEIRSVEDYKKKVPFSKYDDYAEAIERMTRGEENLITAYPIIHYAKTSGSVDNPKNIPLSDRTMKAYMKYSSNIAQCVYDSGIRKIKGRPPKQGKQFITSVVKINHVKNGTLKSPISSAVFLQKKPLMRHVLPFPAEVMFPEEKIFDQKYLHAFYALRERNIVCLVAPFMTALVDSMYYIETNWRSLVHDIEVGRLDPAMDIDEDFRAEANKHLRPDPERAAELRAIFEKSFDEPVIPKIWPNCDYLSAIGGGGFASYTQKIKRYSGGIPIYFNSYAASEGPISSCLEMGKTESTVIPANGFFEFIPVDDESGDPSKTLDLDELEVGREYEIILTNLAGLYRYRLGDVVEVAGYDGQSPKIEFKYRKNQMINISGEKTNEAAAAWAVREFEKATGEAITDFSLYADTDDLPGRYVFFMEPEKHIPKEKHAHYRDICEEKLRIANPIYDEMLEGKHQLPMKLCFLQQETYYLYRDMMMLKGISENQIKPVRVIDTPRKKRFFFGLIDNE